MKKVILILLMLLSTVNVFAENPIVDVTAKMSGKVVTISGTVSSGKGKRVSIQIINPNEERIYVNHITSKENGTFSLKFKLDEDDTKGQYTVMVGGEDVQNPTSCSFRYLKSEEAEIPTIATITANAEIFDRTVTISGNISIGAGKLVSIQVINPNDERIHVNQIISGINGDFLLTFCLDETDTEGTYTVMVGGEKIETIVMCSFKYTKFSEADPEPDDDNDTDGKIVLNGDNVIYKVDVSADKTYSYLVEPLEDTEYFVKISDGFDLKITKADGTEISKNVNTGYFFNKNTEYIIEIIPRTDCKTYELLLEKATPLVMKKNIYYVVKDPLSKLDGSMYTNSEKLKVNWFAADTTDLFYSAAGSIYRYTNGTETKILENVEALFIVSDGKYLYFGDMQRNGKMFRCDKNGENLVQITDTPVSWIYIYDGHLYYTDISDNHTRKSLPLTNLQ